MLSKLKKRKQKHPLMKYKTTKSEENQAIISSQELYFQVNQQAINLLMNAVQMQVDDLCGKFYSPKSDSKYFRAGSVQSEVFDGNNWHRVKCPRVRERFADGSSKEFKLSQLAVIKDTSI